MFEVVKMRGKQDRIKDKGCFLIISKVELAELVGLFSFLRSVDCQNRF